MSNPFDPNNIVQNLEQDAKDKADAAIDNVASKVPGGDQFAQQAKDAVNQGIDQAGQNAQQQAQQQVNDRLGGAGGIVGQVSDMLDGGQNTGGQNTGGQSSGS